MTVCAATFFSTNAVCRVRVDHPALSMETTIPDFLGKQDYRVHDLIRQSEQIINDHYGFWSEPSRGAWNKGTFLCENNECALQRLELEIAIRTIFPCWFDESGTTIGFTDFHFDMAQNSVRANTGWFDRPVMQGAGERLSSVSPTMDEAVSSSVLSRISNSESVIAEVHANWHHWTIRISNLSSTVLYEIDVPFSG